MAGAPSWAHDAIPAPQWPAPVQMDGSSEVVDLSVLGTWIDLKGTASVKEVFDAGLSVFAPKAVADNATLPFGAAQWVHVRIAARPSAAPAARSLANIPGYLPVVIEVPIPLLDRLEFYYANEAGQWETQVSGDLLANSAWTYPSLSPHFEVQLREGVTHDIFLRLKGHTSITEPLKISSPQEYFRHLRINHMLLGLVFGAMSILLALCAVQGVLYRDAVYAWYGAYISLAMLGVAAFTGAGAYFLWNHSPQLADTAPGAILLVVTATALQFVRLLTGTSIRDARLNQIMLGVSIVGFACALAYPFVPRPTLGRGILAVIFPIEVVLILFAAARAWRLGDLVSGLVTLAYVPLGLSLMMALGHALGISRAWTYSQDAIIGALIFEMPLLLVALNMRSRSRHGMIERSQALATQDALTGLLASHLFKDRMRQAVLRSRTHKADAAIVFIDLVNYEQIKRTHGVTVAEQSILRSVIKLRRLLRDVDVASRITENRFGLVLEGVTLRETATQLCARLIALGLMPLKGLKPEVILNFHMAGVVLRECTHDKDSIEPALHDMLSTMSKRTHKPIRFLEPELYLKESFSSDGKDSSGDSDKATAQLCSAPTPDYASAMAPTEPAPLAAMPDKP
jgi:two-component system, sensor histidine kinase LadS